MRAILSGQAGLALLGDGDAVWAVSVEAPEERTPCNWRDAPYLLAGVDDVVELPDVSQEKALDELEQAWRRDRALRLMLILLDREEDTDTRTMAAECVDEHFASDNIRQYAANRFYSAPLPSSAELGRAKQLAGESNAHRVVAFLAKLNADQAVIARTRRAWDEIDPDTFESDEEKARFEAVAIDAGSFCRLAEALDAAIVEQAWMEFLRDARIKRLPRHRNVITAWTNPLRPSPRESQGDGESGTPRLAKDDRQGGQVLRRRSKPAREPTGHQQWTRVQKEVATILADIDKGRETQALRFTQELVERQKSEDNEEFAVKTLCNLAKQMKDRKLHQLQLQFAQWATDEFSWDAQARDQLADAYLCLGRLHEALAQYKETIQRFPNDSVPCNGRSEVLRELGRLDEALAQYKETIQRFPNNSVPCNGRSEVLRDLGRLDEALAQYKETIQRFPNDAVAYCGWCEVLRDLGRLDEALAQYKETIQRFPNDSVPCNGRGEVLRDLGRLDEALAQYEATIQRFPNNSFAYCGRGEVLRELGRLDEALAQYEEAIARLPTDRFAPTAKAHVLIEMKRYDQALSLLSEDPPRSLGDWIAFHVRGMAHLRRGNYETAIELFRQGVRDCPFSASAPFFRTALAVAQLGQRKYADAVTTLENQPGEVADVLRLHAEGEQGHAEEARAANERLLRSQRPRVIGLRDDLGAAFLRDESTVSRTVEWYRGIHERECELVAIRIAA
ncbi:MAG: tetratricopeptide repeat protein [Planctomycetes bacterium]|nr:tetratricopeptide repeat protein [Planctomycetota bacterium]